MDNHITDQTLTSLIKQKNLLKGAAIGLTIVIIIAFAITLYVAIQKKNFALVAVTPASLITLLPILMRLRQINNQIKSRKMA